MPTLTVTHDTDSPWIVTLDGVIVETIRSHYDLDQVLEIASARVDGVVLWKSTGATGFDLTLQAVVLPPLFVAEDGGDVPTIWLRTDRENYPESLLQRTDANAVLFDAIADLLTVEG